MDSRYLRSIEAELANTVDDEVRAKLGARKAFHYARLGKSSEVLGLATEVRKYQLKSPAATGQALCWINLAEGIMHHYEGRVDTARAKLQRAQAMAESLGLHDVCAIANAWLVFSYYLSEQLGPMLEYGMAAIRRTDLQNFSAVSRLSLTIALCLHYIGDLTLARSWYTKARLAALNDGDEATIAALIHSMAWMRVSTLRAKSGLVAESLSDEQDLLIVKAESVQNYEQLVGARSLPNLTPLLQAQEFIINGDFQAALDLIDEYAVGLDSQGFQRLEAGLQADRAYCLAKLGRSADAIRTAQQARDSRSDILHGDDLLLFHSTLQKTFQHLSIATESGEHEGESFKAFKQMLHFKEEMRVVVNTMLNYACENAAYK